jgi:uncharacterized DUF497 family protein
VAVTFDPEKNARNIAERGLPFDLAERLDWATAQVKQDTLRDYGEVRLQVLGLIESRRYMVVVTLRDGDLRIISLRRASRKEARLYGKRQ